MQTLDYTPHDLDTDNLTLEEQCDRILAETLKQERAERALRRHKPTPQLYDG